MRGRVVVLAVVAAVAVATAYLVGTARGPASAAGEPDDRTVTTQGTGTVAVVPDQLALALAVEVRRPVLQKALDEADARVRQVTEAVVAAGVPAEAVQTAGLSTYPVQRGRSAAITGYAVTSSLAVTLDDLDRSGAVVTAATAAGGEGFRIEDLRLQVADPEAALAPARAAAYEQARTQAEQYAEQVGAELGDVVRLSEVPASGAAYGEASASAADSAGGSVQPGQTDLATSVTVVFSLR